MRPRAAVLRGNRRPRRRRRELARLTKHTYARLKGGGPIHSLAFEFPAAYYAAERLIELDREWNFYAAPE